MNKKIVGVVLGVILAVVIAAIIFVNPSGKDDLLSKREWMEMLTDKTGIDNPVEWGIIESDSEIDDKTASGEFIAITSMKSMGEDKLMFLGGNIDVFSDKALVDIAVDSNIVQKEQLKGGFTELECEEILERLNDLYFGELWPDDLSEIIYKDKVVELGYNDILACNVYDEWLKVSPELETKLSVGDIVIYDVTKTGIKAGGKIVSVGVDGVINIEEVAIEDVIESLTLSDVRELTFEDIEQYYGNTGLVNIEAQPTMFDDKDEIIDSKGFKITAKTSEDNGIEVSVVDNETGKNISIPTGKNLADGVSVDVKIDVDKIIIGGQARFGLTGLNYADVAIDTHAVVSGGISGEKESVLELFETPVPIGNGVLSVKVKINLVLSVDGTLSIEAEMPMMANVRYTKDNGLNVMKQNLKYKNPQITADANMDFKLRGEPVLIFLGVGKILDAEADLGVNVNVNATTRPNKMICIEMGLSFPTFTLSIGADGEEKTLLDVLGVSQSWDIITKEKAHFRDNNHLEKKPGESIKRVDECTYKEGEESKEEAEKKDDISADNIGVLSDMSRFKGYKLPLSFVFYSEPDGDYDKVFIEDKGDYYLVRGSLIAGECVPSSDVGENPGDSFTTISGKTYTVEGMESYNNDQRQKILLSCDDSKEYEILNLPAWDMDKYSMESYYVIHSKDGKIFQNIFEDVWMRFNYDTEIKPGLTFDSAVKSGAYNELTWQVAYDIQMSDAGEAVIVGMSDIHSNGMWDSSNSEAWRKKME